MTTTEIKKGKGIEDLFKGFIPVKPEELKEIEVAEGRFQGLMGEYERFLDMECGDLDNRLNKITDILTPTDINLFLQTTIRHEQHKNYDWATGHFISELIQNSYDAGHNDFTLSTTALKRIHNLGSYLEGTKKRPLEITIKGNIGYSCGCSAKNAAFNIKGNARDSCGFCAENSTFKTPNRRTLKKMLKEVSESNRIIFIHPDGTEEIVKDYADNI